MSTLKFLFMQMKHSQHLNPRKWKDPETPIVYPRVSSITWGTVCASSVLQSPPPVPCMGFSCCCTARSARGSFACSCFLRSEVQVAQPGSPIGAHKATGEYLPPCTLSCWPNSVPGGGATVPVFLSMLQFHLDLTSIPATCQHLPAKHRFWRLNPPPAGHLTPSGSTR